LCWVTVAGASRHASVRAPTFEQVPDDRPGPRRAESSTARRPAQPGDHDHEREHGRQEGVPHRRAPSTGQRALVSGYDTPSRRCAAGDRRATASNAIVRSGGPARRLIGAAS
jgi:hypothetical protein